MAHERKGRSIKAGGISVSAWDEQEQQERGEGDQRKAGKRSGPGVTAQ